MNLNTKNEFGHKNEFEDSAESALDIFLWLKAHHEVMESGDVL